MDPNRVLLVICLTVFIVVGVNATLLVALRRGNDVRQIDLFKRAAGRARQPWVHEDEALSELSRRVEALRSRGAGEQGSKGAPLNIEEPRFEEKRSNGTEE